MSDFVHEYKLQCYKKVKSLNEEENLWLTEDSVTGKRFVMRRLSPDSRRVYEQLADIRHPNIVEIFDVFVYEGFLYVIEEYLEWELLLDRVRGEGLSDSFVFSVAKQLFSGLSALHDWGIVHRDVKPDNIMISGQGTIKLIDFHIARLFSAEKARDTCPKGSIDYAAPEQFGFTQTDCRGDLYSAGVTLNVLSAGALPGVKVCRGRIGVVARRCMEFDPARRYQTAEQALNHIKRLEKRRPALIAVWGLVLCLAAGTFFLWENHQQPPAELFPAAEEISRSTQYQERIIICPDPGTYPAALLTGDKTQAFSIEQEDGAKTAVRAEKKAERLNLTLMEEGTGKKNFS